jgi:hypothetical protein
MRMSSNCFVIALLFGSMIPFAAHAQYDRMSHRNSYAACHCHFGYLEKNANTCVPAVSCTSEGGRCWEPCSSQVQ